MMAAPTEERFITHIASPLGELTACSDGLHLTGLWFQDQRFFPAALCQSCAERNLPVFAQTRQWLSRYFQGAEPDYFPPLWLSGTAFQMRVWELLREIPYGSTVSYGELARRVAVQGAGGFASARAIGGAVARNPIILLIPCHRVLGANAALTGYAAGLDRKRRLLELERIALCAQRNVEFVQISVGTPFHA